MQSIKFSDIATFCYGKMPDKIHIIKNGFPIFSGYQISGYYDTYNCENDELVLIARGVGGTGEIRKTPDKCWLTNLAIKISLKDENLALKDYLFYKFQANDLRILRSGSAQPQITINDLMDYEFNVPNIVEQRHIVDIIQTLFLVCLLLYLQVLCFHQ